MLITIQYLEPSPDLENLSPKQAVETLRSTFDLLPVTHLLIGWQVPGAVLEACRKETERAKVKLMRWQPLLTGDGGLQPQSEWQVVGLAGSTVPGFLDKPEFTFVCPNNPLVVAQAINRIKEVIQVGLYDGLFLDRLRWPSPSVHPLQNLGCFCRHCQNNAVDVGINLVDLQKQILQLATTSAGKVALVQSLLGENELQMGGDRSALTRWLSFRAESITFLVENVAGLVRASELEIGLDCFSPGLTRLVGQDLTSLSVYTDWIKVMCYAHTLGPAGLPFEISGLLDFVTQEGGLTQTEALVKLGSWMNMPLPVDRRQLLAVGLNAEALAIDLAAGIQRARVPILAGLELVDMPGVTSLNEQQILRDHRAAKATGVAGLAISWDLRHIPRKWLALVSSIWRE